MNKLKFLQIAVAILLLINIALISFLVLNKPPRPHEPKQEIINRLGFDQKQITIYEDLIKKHQEKINNFDSEIGVLKSDLFASLKNEKNIPFQDSIINLIAQKQVSIEKLHLAHFEGIHAMCKPNQEQNFIALTNDLSNLFSQKKMPQPR